MSLPRYTEYKDSGVAWMGQVPTHWSVERFKWNIERNDGGVWGDEPDGIDDTAVLRSTEQTAEGNWRIADPAYRKLSANERAAALLESEDLLITKSSGSSLHIGKTTLVTDEIASLGYCYSNFMQRLRTSHRIAPKIAWYFLNNGLSRLQFDLLSNSTTGLANLNGSMIGELMVAVAPSEEQSAIAAFLDRETGMVDALIAEQEKLLTLLAEKRQATISHAVTRGLNPDAPMKDSGAPWLGEVPAHWHVLRLASVYREVAELGNDELPILSVSIHDGVSDKELDGAEMDRKVTRSDDRSKYKRVAPNDLTYNMMRAWQGGFGTVTVHGQVSPAYVVARPLGEIRTMFVEQLLRTPQAIEQVRRYSRGITEFRLRLYWEEFKNIRIAVSPVAEQDEILSAATKEIADFNKLTGTVERAITLLKERRSALIAAAVTGKIDVRQAV